MNPQKPANADLHTVQTDLAQQLQQLPAPEHIWVACSGGLDSSVLLFVLDGLQRRLESFELGVLHVNYALRGLESDRDERLVREAAGRYGREIRVLNVDPRDHPPRKSGIQEWARTLRYEWFARQQGPRDWIAVAHHRDDWIETIFARLCRGHGLMAVGGMQMFHEGVWRPLLNMTRKRLEDLAARHQIPFGEDSSNRGLDYTRNRLRLQILPELERLFPGFQQNIWMHAQDLQDALRLAQEERPALDLQETLNVTRLEAHPPFLARQEIGRYLQARAPGVRVSRDLLHTIHTALVRRSVWTGMLAPGMQAVCRQGVLSIACNQTPVSERWQQFRAALLDESLDIWPPAAP